MDIRRKIGKETSIPYEVSVSAAKTIDDAFVSVFASATRRASRKARFEILVVMSLGSLVEYYCRKEKCNLYLLYDLWRTREG